MQEIPRTSRRTSHDVLQGSLRERTRVQVLQGPSPDLRQGGGLRLALRRPRGPRPQPALSSSSLHDPHAATRCAPRSARGCPLLAPNCAQERDTQTGSPERNEARTGKRVARDTLGIEMAAKRDDREVDRSRGLRRGHRFRPPQPRRVLRGDPADRSKGGFQGGQTLLSIDTPPDALLRRHRARAPRARRTPETLTESPCRMASAAERSPPSFPGPRRRCESPCSLRVS